MQKRRSLKLRYYGPIVTVLSPCIALIVMCSVALQGCIRVSRGELSEAVGTAVIESILRHRAEVFQKLKEGVDRLAVAEMKRLNAAEKEDAAIVRFDPTEHPNPLGIGWLLKDRRRLLSYEVVEVKERWSSIFPYEVMVGYSYETFETEKRSSARPSSAFEVLKDPNFYATGKTGSMELLYRFDAALEWTGKVGEAVRTTGEPLSEPARLGFGLMMPLPPEEGGDPPRSLLHRRQLEQKLPSLPKPTLRRKRNLN